MRLLITVLVVLVGVWISGGTDLATQFDVETGLSGCDYWAGRESRLVVVNPAVPATDGSVLSLRGEWEFSDFRHALEARDLRYFSARPRP